MDSRLESTLDHADRYTVAFILGFPVGLTARFSITDGFIVVAALTVGFTVDGFIIGIKVGFIVGFADRFTAGLTYFNFTVGLTAPEVPNVYTPRDCQLLGFQMLKTLETIRSRASQCLKPSRRSAPELA